MGGEMTESPPLVVTGAVIAASDPVIVLVVDDAHDDELVAAIAAERVVPSERFGGAWRAGVVREGDVQRVWVEFLLIEYGGGMERSWRWQDPPTALYRIAAARDHLVALLPAEYAGHEEGWASVKDLVQRLLGALIAEVSEPSDAIRALAAVGAIDLSTEA